MNCVELAAVLATVVVAAQQPPAGGARVVEIPGVEGPLPGDVILSVDGREGGTAPSVRRRIAESMGRTVKTRVRRGDAEIEFDWSIPTGVYGLETWPAPADLFRRAHEKDAASAGAQAGARALQALHDGNARSALRLLERAAEEGMRDPLLDWAEAWILLRHQNRPAEAVRPLARADEALSKTEGPAPSPARGLVRTAWGFVELQHRKDFGAARRRLAEARADGADTAELARAMAALLPPGSDEALAATAWIFDEDPLDVVAGAVMAKNARGAEEHRRYGEALARLTGKPRDPAVALAGLVVRVKVDAAEAPALEAFLAAHPGLGAKERAAAQDLLGRIAELQGGWEEAFDRKRSAMETWATAERAKGLVEAAKRTGRYEPVLRLLRGYYEQKLNTEVLQEYMRLYVDLQAAAYRERGLPALEAAIRLRGIGRWEEAAAFLESRAETLGLPELRVAAGLMLQEAGRTEVQDRFQPEIDFWTQGFWTRPGWTDGLRLCLLLGRAGEARGDLGVPDRIDGPGRSWAYPAVYRAAQAAVHFRTGKAESGKELLRQAIDGLSRPDAAVPWIPIYAEGRVCSTPRDFIEALNERWNAGLSVPGP